METNPTRSTIKLENTSPALLFKASNPIFVLTQTATLLSVLLLTSMGLLKNVWKHFTRTKALDDANEYERYFFDTLYRVTYATGLSRADQTVSYKIYRHSVTAMIAGIILGEIWFAYSDTRTIDELVGALNVILIHLMNVFKAKNLADHKDIYKKLSTCMDSTLAFKPTRERQRLAEYWKQIHETEIKWLLCLGNCSLIAWHLYPLLDDIDYNLMIGVHLPIRYDSPLSYSITFLFVGIAFYYISHFCMVIDIILKAHFLPLVCQMTILADCFENIIQECSDGFEGIPMSKLIKNNEFISRYLMKLGNLVKQHDIILKHAMDLRSIQSGPMLAQMISSGTLICLVGFQATTAVVEDTTKFLMSLFYLGYNMYGLYTLCRWCEEVTTQSANIGKAVFGSGWECGLSALPGVRATIMLIIKRTNKPLVFTASGLFEISLKSYNALVKTSYSALTVLLGMRND